MAHGEDRATRNLTGEPDQALGSACAGTVGGLEVRWASLRREVARVVVLHLVPGESLPLAGVALPQALVECYRLEAEFVGDDAGGDCCAL